MDIIYPSGIHFHHSRVPHSIWLRNLNLTWRVSDFWSLKPESGGPKPTETNQKPRSSMRSACTSELGNLKGDGELRRVQHLTGGGVDTKFGLGWNWNPRNNIYIYIFFWLVEKKGAPKKQKTKRGASSGEVEGCWLETPDLQPSPSTQTGTSAKSSSAKSSSAKSSANLYAINLQVDRSANPEKVQVQITRLRGQVREFPARGRSLFLSEGRGLDKWGLRWENKLLGGRVQVLDLSELQASHGTEPSLKAA